MNIHHGGAESPEKICFAPPCSSGWPLDNSIRACMSRCMKTITLDDEAYQRLRSWKRSPADSFSKVVKRVVPEAGTLGAMALFVEERHSSDPKRDEILEKTVEDRSSGKTDPWT